MSGERLAGKRAVVLGAASPDNMGQHIARRFAAEGAQVVVAGRDMVALAALAEEIGGTALTCDITDRGQVFGLVDKTRLALGGIDIGVNATGWGLIKRFRDTTEDELDRMAAIQFKGAFFFLQALAEGMADGGSIIQISSATARILIHNHAAYMGTKAGIDHVVRCVADEYGARRIRANSLSPGLTRSPMTEEFYDAAQSAFVPCYPLGRIGTAEDVAAAAVWLASDECFMTGENLQVNGGLVLRRNPNHAEIKAAMARSGG